MINPDTCRSAQVYQGHKGPLPLTDHLEITKQNKKRPILSAICLHVATGFLDLRAVGTATWDVVTGEMGITTVICVCFAEQSVPCREESKNSLVFISHVLSHFNLLQHSACYQPQRWLWHPSWAEGGHLEAAIGWRCLTSYTSWVLGSVSFYS